MNVPFHSIFDRGGNPLKRAVWFVTWFDWALPLRYGCDVGRDYVHMWIQIGPWNGMAVWPRSNCE